MSGRHKRALRLGGFSRWLAALVGVGIAATSPVAAQSVSPSAAPSEWVRYAEAATRTITGWLEADRETAARFRTYLDATRPAPDQPTAPLMLKVWIEADGTISRLDFPPFAHAEPNADLRALVVGQHLAAAPPKDMLLPLRILVQLPPVPGMDAQTLEEANRQVQPPAQPPRAVTDPLGLPEPGGANRLNLEGRPGAEPRTQH